MLAMLGCTTSEQTDAVRLNAEQAKSLAVQLANQQAHVLYQCQPFHNGPEPQFSDGRWVWTDRQACGESDVEATVSFAADGSSRKVKVLLLDSRPAEELWEPRRRPVDVP